MSLRVIWQYMDRSVTQKVLYGPQKLRSFGPYNIFWVTDRSIYCHMTFSAMNYLLFDNSLSDAEVQNNKSTEGNNNKRDNIRLMVMVFSATFVFIIWDTFSN